jgi:transcriptional regulator of arginine metabolism
VDVVEHVSKSFRQNRIVDLVRNHEIHTQKELLGRLRQLGITATQVTVSRDLHDLKIVKTASGYRRLPEAQPIGLEAIAREFVTAAIPAENLVVVRTTPGNASTVAKAIDGEAWPEIIGTVAGDDTVLAVAADRTRAAQAARKLLKLK